MFNGYFCFLFRTEPLSKGSAVNISSTTAKQEDVKAIGEDSRICKWEERSARAVWNTEEIVKVQKKATAVVTLWKVDYKNVIFGISPWQNNVMGHL